jgi:hypothetical protein
MNKMEGYMKDGRNESVLVAGLYTEWLSNMMAYRHQLDEMETTLRLNETHQHTDAVKQLLGHVEVTRTKLDVLLDKIENAQLDFYQLDIDTIQISLAEMIARRQLRDDIRKTEQAVFLLRYRIGQLVQKVS